MWNLCDFRDYTEKCNERKSTLKSLSIIKRNEMWHAETADPNGSGGSSGFLVIFENWLDPNFPHQNRYIFRICFFHLRKRQIWIFIHSFLWARAQLSNLLVFHPTFLTKWKKKVRFQILLFNMLARKLKIAYLWVT